MKHKKESVTLYIKEVMQRQGKTNVWLANKLGYTQEAISRMVTGSAIPSVSTLKKISELLCVSLDVLLCGYDQSQQLNVYIVRGCYFEKNLSLSLELREKKTDKIMCLAKSWDELKLYCFDNGITREQLEIVT